MTLSIRIEVTGTAPAPCALREYDPIEDSIVSLLLDVCECLEDSGAVNFFVGGFGQTRWPVDVYMDLPVVLEQLPVICVALASGDQDAVLDFFEQGVQRQLVLHQNRDYIDIECISQLDWQPNPRYIRVTRNEVVVMFRRLRDDFEDLVQVSAPSLLDNPWFREWKRQVDTL